MKKFLIAATLIAFSSGTAFAATGNTSTATGSATATVVAPITLTHNTGALSFGKFTVGSGGTVVVSATGAGSVTGNTTLVSGGTTTADSFSVTGDPSRSYTIATTNSTVTNGTVTMAFTTLASAATATLSTTGTGSFTVGGTLTAVGTEPAGSYAGTYNATVTYN